MERKYLKIIIFTLIIIGGILTLQMLITSYGMALAHPPTTQEQLAIAIIGAFISISWYFPFFIIAFWLSRKIKNSNH